MDRRLRISLDLLVLGLFCYLLAYRPGAGLYRHGILGVILLILFMVHLLVNRRFFTSLCKGRYTARRILTVTLDVLLLLSGGLMLISSVLLSGDVFDFSPFSQTQLARELHVSAAAWMLLLLFLHAGLHTANFLQRIFYRLSRLGRVVSGVIFGTILLR